MLLVLLLGSPDSPEPAVFLPRAASEALAVAGYAFPEPVRPEHLSRADFDASGYEDWAVLVRPGSAHAAILVAYQFKDHWRAGSIDLWDSTPGPVRIQVLPAGSYTRDPPYNRPREANEADGTSSSLPGVLATFADGRRRAYQLGAHAWQYVYLGPSH